MSAGVVVWRMRRRFRRALAVEVAGRSLAEAVGGGRERGLSQLVWRNGFEVGHPVIDKHHQELFARCNELIEFILADKPRGDIELRLYELFWAFEAHCEAEHKILSRGDDPLSDEEIDGYEAMLADAKALRERYHLGELGIGDLVGFIAYDLLAQHVTGGGARVRG